ncbi:MAG TPA: serine/threonine-protein kinase [Candidatus Limnocylindria bacterium]|nr:serine/threonine-protein kinase [Candidatus Limnocylindria bacterium]
MPQPPPTADSPPLPDLTGRTLGDYQVLRRLGTGGMGQVYLARQLSLKREVALKLLRTDQAANSTALLRFQAEAEAVAKLNHPNIVHIHQMGEFEGQRYMVLEFVDGRNLRDHLARRGPPDLPVTLSIIRQVVLALQKAHEQGIVHRDIKPENILVTRRVEVKVTDFGLSRFFSGPTPALNLTQSGVTLGTPLYMSPEQVQGKPVVHRSDIYSLGVTCYHLLTGEPPFRGSTAFDVALKHVQEQPRPITELRPDLPADLCGMVHKMMAKDPDERYQSAREILRDLVKVRDGRTLGLAQTNGSAAQVPLTLSGTNANGVPAANSAVLEPVAPRRWVLWVGAALGGVVALGIGVLAYVGLNPSRDTAPSPMPVTPASGLPDVRLPERFVTARERELLALLDKRGAESQDVINHSIELGLLYLRERRLNEADDRFTRLEKEQFPKALYLTRTAGVTGRLGRAVVAAYRDTPNAAQQSNDLFL